MNLVVKLQSRIKEFFMLKKERDITTQPK
jgi:hypothetical protein